MGLVKCFECKEDLSPDNFHEVEKIETGEVVCLCNEHYNEFTKSGRLEHVDEDGNRTRGDTHIYCGTNTKTETYQRPCPNCGSFTYLGVLIPTVSIFYADYYSPSFQCHNKLCDPVYERGHQGNFNWIIDSGAFWDAEDEYYYTPQKPRPEEI